jgi:hypothetical protein
VATALYFPFSRCLDDLALKQAVLLYDELIFADPVRPDERAALFRDAQNPGGHSDPGLELAERWRSQAELHYKLLERNQLVRVIDPTDVVPADAAYDLAIAGLEVDLGSNGGRRLFPNRVWNILERRVTSELLAHDDALRRWLPEGFDNSFRRGSHPVLRVPYSVGSSLSLTSALAVAHAEGATIMTDSEPHHVLLLRRLRSAAEDRVPGTKAPPASPTRRRLIELRLIE